MIDIAEKSLVTVHSDGIAIILMIGLLAIFNTYWFNRDDFAGVLFKRLSLSIIANAVFASVYYAFRYKSLGLPPFVKMLIPTLDELSATFVLLFWVLYAEYMINSSRDRLRNMRIFYYTPVVVVTFFTLLNLFTGIMFTVDDMMLVHYTPFFYMLEVVEYTYGCLPIFMVMRYRRIYGEVHFFSLTPVLSSVFVASVFSQATGYSVRAFGFAIGMVFLFFSYAVNWRFNDRESLLFNRHYIDHIISLSGERKREYQSAVFFRTENVTREFFEILRREFPREGELIRLNQDTVLLLTEKGKTSILSLFTALVQEAADEYDESHPDEKAMDIITSVRKRKENEAVEEFIARVSAV